MTQGVMIALNIMNIKWGEFEWYDPGEDERHYSSLDPESSHSADWGKSVLTLAKAWLKAYMIYMVPYVW